MIIIIIAIVLTIILLVGCIITYNNWKGGALERELEKAKQERQQAELRRKIELEREEIFQNEMDQINQMSKLEFRTPSENTETE